MVQQRRQVPQSSEVTLSSELGRKRRHCLFFQRVCCFVVEQVTAARRETRAREHQTERAPWRKSMLECACTRMSMLAA
jgi:hypothetical protein